MITFDKTVDAGKIMVSDESLGCDTHSITFANCGEEGDLTLYFQAVIFNKVEYDKIIEPIENGKGDEISRKTQLRRYYSFNVVVNDYYLDALEQAIIKSDTATLTDVIATEDFEIYDMSLAEQQPSDFNELHIVKLKYRVVDNDDELGMDACCGSVLAEEPYEDECPPGGDPPDAECEELEIEVNRIGDDLHATVTGNDGAFTVNWRYRPNQNSAWVVLINGASSVGLGGYGEYEAIVNNGTCQDRDKYLYPDPCAGLGIEAEQVGIAIIATLTGQTVECEDGFFDLALWDTELEEWVVQGHDGTNIFMPEESGLYLIGYTCETTQCVVTTIVDFDATNTCPALVLEITRDEDVLTVGVTGEYEGELTYEWTLDDGESVTEIGSGPGVTIIGNGLYEVTVFNGECEYKKHIVINDPCDSCDLTISIDSSGVTEGVGTLVAVIATTEDTDGIIVNWDIMTANGFVPYDHGTMETAISEQGAYRLTVQLANGCKRYKYYFNSDCLECEEFTVTITEDGGVFTAEVDCETPTFNWIRMDQEGDHETGVTTASITPTLPGLYIVNVDCGGCPGQGRFIAYECECLEVFIPGSPEMIAVCGGE